MFKKSIIMGVAAVGAMSLVGTGFAGWVIAKTASHQEQGNVVAYAVSDETLTVETAFADQKGEIIFGKPVNYSADPTAWLTPDGTVSEENKSVTVNYTIGNLPTGKTAYTSFRIQIPDVDENLAVFTVKVGTDTLSQDQDGYFYKYNVSGTAPTVTISFEWGTDFGEKNPYTYYKQAYTDDLATEAKKDLTALDNAMKNATFVIDSRSLTGEMAANSSIFAAAQQPSNQQTDPTNNG